MIILGACDLAGEGIRGLERGGKTVSSEKCDITAIKEILFEDVSYTKKINLLIETCPELEKGIKITENVDSYRTEFLNSRDCDPSGDVNGDGVLDNYDVFMALNIILGVETADQEVISCADMNNNNILEVTDLVNMVQRILAQESESGIFVEWVDWGESDVDPQSVSVMVSVGDDVVLNTGSFWMDFYKLGVGGDVVEECDVVYSLDGEYPFDCNDAVDSCMFWGEIVGCGLGTYVVEFGGCDVIGHCGEFFDGYTTSE